MKTIILETSPMSDSATLNIALGCILFTASLFISKLYLLEFMKQIHHRMLSHSFFLRSLCQTLFSLVPYLLYNLSDTKSGMSTRMCTTLNASFISSALSLASILVFSKKSIQTNLTLFNRVSGSTIVCIGLALLSLFTAQAAVTSAIFLMVIVVLALNSLRRIYLLGTEDARYRRNRNITNIVELSKALFYPFEILMDYSIVIYTGKKKIHLLSFSKRALISPILNTFFFLLYLRFNLSLTAFFAVLTTGFILSLSMYACSKRSGLFYIIALYSFIINCAYIFLLFQQQVLIVGNLSKIFHIDAVKTTVLYLPPLIAIFSLTIASYFYSIGLTQVSLFAILFEWLFSVIGSSFVLILIGYHQKFIQPSEKLVLESLLMNLSLSSILNYYGNFTNGRILREFSLISSLLIIAHYWIVYKGC